MEKIMLILPKVRGEYKENYNLKHLTWFKVGGNAEIFFKPLDISDLSDFFSQYKGEFPITILGAGSNIIIRDGGIKGCTIKLGQNFTNIEFISEQALKVGGSCLNYNLAKFCESNAIAGFEFLVGVPGTIGGGVAMNAGSYGSEFKDLVESIEVMDQKGQILHLTNKEIGFKYRGNNLPPNFIIINVIFKIVTRDQKSISARMIQISTKRAKTQPIKERTGGSTFANPLDSEYKSWQLIDKAGLRGYRVGDASISTMHCNFMINHGSATASELENLGNFVQQRVFEDSGIRLEWEIRRIGVSL